MSGGLDCPAVMLQSFSLPPPSSADLPGGLPSLPLPGQGQSRFRARCLEGTIPRHARECLSRWMAGPGASAGDQAVIRLTGTIHHTGPKEGWGLHHVLLLQQSQPQDLARRSNHMSTEKLVHAYS